MRGAHERTGGGTAVGRWPPDKKVRARDGGWRGMRWSEGRRGPITSQRRDCRLSAAREHHVGLTQLNHLERLPKGVSPGGARRDHAEVGPLRVQPERAQLTRGTRGRRRLARRAVAGRQRQRASSHRRALAQTAGVPRPHARIAARPPSTPFDPLRRRGGALARARARRSRDRHHRPCRVTDDGRQQERGDALGSLVKQDSARRLH